MLVKFEMMNSKPDITPIDVNTKIYADEGKELEDQTEYIKILGSLIYLTLTRLDITFSVGVLSRYMQNPHKPHVYVVRRVLKYVKGTMDYEVEFKKEHNIELTLYCNADYAGDPSTRRSTTCFVFLVGNSVVSWCSKRQPVVSLSTTEAVSSYGSAKTSLILYWGRIQWCFGGS
ncbi:secreted RxLR effector protein 161-like [Helianthus annuus]|uniref:secreted RxLR effector protein 161-like n=1 Tax=Helianthus annuus TaxID=4232 RepID=UPI000B8F58F1|nr:secreted RxLR effector protein 161-like [Helianthus annuus]